MIGIALTVALVVLVVMAVRARPRWVLWPPRCSEPSSSGSASSASWATAGPRRAARPTRWPASRAGTSWCSSSSWPRAAEAGAPDGSPAERDELPRDAHRIVVGQQVARVGEDAELGVGQQVERLAGGVERVEGV